MAQSYAAHPFRTEIRKRHYRTLSLICDDESLSDAQLKAYQTRLQEYHTFLDAVSRLALCGNVCVTEEVVTIGEHGLLTGESLNALQHAGAISVYNTLQQNNWEFPVSEEGEVAIVKAHNPIPDEFLDSEKPIRSDWPAVHISECFVEGERAKLHGSVRPLRTFLPPTIMFRNAADIDEDVPEPEVNVVNPGPDGTIEIVHSGEGLSVKKPSKDGKDQEYIPIDEYYFGRQDGNPEYLEEKGGFRFKCAVCQRIFYSNIKLMSHIIGHVDETSQACLDTADSTECPTCDQQFSSAFELRDHIDKKHGGVVADQKLTGVSLKSDQLVAQTASQLLMQQRGTDLSGDSSIVTDSVGVLDVGSDSSGVLSCRICGKTSASELALAHHLQSTHRQREMPYVCHLCSFRSSMFEDILCHFKKMHEDSNHLLCIYCLRIFTSSDARSTNSQSANTGASTIGLGTGVGQTQVYLQHLRMHQVKHQLRRCPSCRLNFTNKSDYQLHRRLDHKAMRGVGIERQGGRSDSYETEAYDLPDQLSTTKEGGRSQQTHIQSLNQMSADQIHDALDSIRQAQPHITLMNAPEAGCAKSVGVNNLPENIEQTECLECGKCLGHSEHKQYLPCSMCCFATCCSIAFNRHIQQAHLYSNPSQSSDPDSSAPMIRQIYFEWMKDGLKPQIEHACSDNNETNLESTVARDEDQRSDLHEITDLTPEITFETALETAAASESNKHEKTETKHPITFEPNVNYLNQPVGSPEDMNINESIVKYMEKLLDARLFYCSHCGINNLDGNSLARHLVEECGTLTATLNPDPGLLVARSQAEEQQSQVYQQMYNNQETSILFEATDHSVPMANETTGLTSSSDGDVIMMAVDPEQLTSMGLTEADQSLMTGGQLIAQMGGAGGTTIDVTDAGGEVVQQFILPDDLQLEEGQTLVMIHGEDGQPQLAIVNQADLINADNSQLLLQTEDEQAGGILLYSNGIESQPQMAEGVVLGREEEKENQQYIV